MCVGWWLFSVAPLNIDHDAPAFFLFMWNTQLVKAREREREKKSSHTLTARKNMSEIEQCAIDYCSALQLNSNWTWKRTWTTQIHECAHTHTHMAHEKYVIFETCVPHTQSLFCTGFFCLLFVGPKSDCISVTQTNWPCKRNSSSRSSSTTTNDSNNSRKIKSVHSCTEWIVHLHSGQVYSLHFTMNCFPCTLVFFVFS